MRVLHGRAPRIAAAQAHRRVTAKNRSRRPVCTTPAAPPAPLALTAGRRASMTAGAPAECKLRFLCLHGYLQNGEVFKSRVGSLRKGLKSQAEFVFIDAPYLVEHPDSQQVAATEVECRSWWKWSDVEPESQRPSRAAHYRGWEASQAAITAALEAHAPVDGLLGFSQGATAAALYLAHAAAAGEPRGPRGQLRLAVLAAGFLPRDASYAAALAVGCPALPTLFVYGEADALVPEERTRGLWEAFAPGAVHRHLHGGAHWVPTCSGNFKQRLLQFFDEAKAAGGWGPGGHGGSSKQAVAAAAATAAGAENSGAHGPPAAAVTAAADEAVTFSAGASLV